MTRKIRLLPLLPALLLALTLGGCGGKLPARPEKSVTVLTCLQPRSTPQLLALADGQVLSCWTDYDGGVTHLDIVDVLHDLVGASAQLAGTLTLAGENLSDGRFALRDGENGQLCLLDGELRQTGVLSVPNTDGFLSHDGSVYYYISEHVLCAMDTATGAASPVALAEELRFAAISSIHPTGEQLVLTVYTDPFTLTPGTAVVDIPSGKITLLQSALCETVFTGGGMALTGVDGDTLAPYAVFSTADAPDSFYGFTGAAADGGEAEWHVLSQSPYLVATTGDTTALCRLGPTVQRCALGTCGLTGALRGSVYLPAGDLIVGSVYDGGQCSLYLIDPAALPFTEPIASSPLDFSPVSETVAAACTAVPWDAPLPDSLTPLRQRADALSARADVRILLSSQCAEVCRFSGRDVVTTDGAAVGNEAECIARTLDTLETCLMQYPEDFFRQFSTAYGDGGVCFLLTGPVNDDMGTVGFTFELGPWQCIALDVTLGSLEGTVYHEIWHATENRIVSRDASAFDAQGWNALNPEDFAYYLDYPGQPDSGKWTLYDAAGGAAYFVDDYGRTNAHEDRARIMEFSMQEGYSARAVADSPFLTAKLRYMAETVRTHFTTKNWDNVRWERYF